MQIKELKEFFIRSGNNLSVTFHPGSRGCGLALPWNLNHEFYTHLNTHRQNFEALQEERKKILEEIFNAKDEQSKAPSVQLQKLSDIERKVRHLVEQGNLTQNFLVIFS